MIRVLRKPTALVAVACMACAAAGCTSANARSSPSTTTTLAPATPAAIRRAIDRAAAYLVGQYPDIDPDSLMLLDYAYRRWGITALSGARELALTTAHAADSRGGSAILFQAVDPALPDPTADAVHLAGPTDQALYAALHCHTGDLSADVANLRRLMARGSYYLTHAAIASQWYAELGCALPGAAALRARMVAELTHAETADHRVTDLAMERVFVLAYLGAPAATLSPTRVAAILHAQAADGSWAVVTGDASLRWHAAAVGVLALAPQLGPGNPVPMLVR